MVKIFLGILKIRILYENSRPKSSPKLFEIRETELRLDILPQTMAKDLENIVDLDHELHKPSGVERKRKELENNQNSGIVIFQNSQQCIN